ncbi:N-acetyltransferase domain-containing protein [Balamuthia mandrillaris]
MAASMKKDVPIVETCGDRLQDMRLRPVREADFDLLLSLDQKVYPCEDVTYNALKAWYRRNPEFGMIYDLPDDGEIVATAIFIPLNEKGWNKLINGELDEGELGPEEIFDAERDSAIGIHVYHLEKLDNKVRSFFQTAMTDLNAIIQRLREAKAKRQQLALPLTEEQGQQLLKVVGFSGLAVTNNGIGLLFNKLNMMERDYICQQHILQRKAIRRSGHSSAADKNESDLTVFKCCTKKELAQKLAEGYDYVNRCKMLVTYPTEPSIVWIFLN